MVPLYNSTATYVVVTWHAGPPTWAPRAMPPHCCGYGWQWCDSCPLASCPTASSSNPADIAQEGTQHKSILNRQLLHFYSTDFHYDGVRRIVTLPDILPTRWSLTPRLLPSCIAPAVSDRKLDKGLGTKPSPCTGVEGRKNVWKCYDVGLGWMVYKSSVNQPSVS